MKIVIILIIDIWREASIDPFYVILPERKD